nr:hypothetical protein GZ18F2_34 [uncultured archaeon GZfos18F2]
MIFPLFENQYFIYLQPTFRLFPCNPLILLMALFQNRILYIYNYLFCRVDRFLPMLQVEFCFLSLPPGFPAVPQYFNHTSVGPGPSQNRACAIYAHGSS